jgi:hypothetical protein
MVKRVPACINSTILTILKVLALLRIHVQHGNHSKCSNEAQIKEKFGEHNIHQMEEG